VRRFFLNPKVTISSKPKGSIKQAITHRRPCHRPRPFLVEEGRLVIQPPWEYILRGLVSCLVLGWRPTGQGVGISARLGILRNDSCLLGPATNDTKFTKMEALYTRDVAMWCLGCMTQRHNRSAEVGTCIPNFLHEDLPLYRYTVGDSGSPCGVTMAHRIEQPRFEIFVLFCLKDLTTFRADGDPYAYQRVDAQSYDAICATYL